MSKASEQYKNRKRAPENRGRRTISILAAVLSLKIPKPCFSSFQPSGGGDRNVLPPAADPTKANPPSRGPAAREENSLLQDGIATGRDPESTFWYSVIRKEEEEGKDGINGSCVGKFAMPCVPAMDQDGPLPPGAYLTLGDPFCGPKETCRLSIALNLLQSQFNPNDDDEVIDVSEMVGSMQSYIDSGLTSFQLKSYPPNLVDWAEENVYGRLRKETPLSVVERCQLTVPLHTPSPPTDVAASAANGGGISAGVARFNAVAIRETILASLARIGGDALDNVQVQYRRDSPYHIDVLDYLEDLKREGIVRSVSGRNFPSDLERMAQRSGFELDSSQFDFNLLGSEAYDTGRLVCDNLNVPLLVSNPLAGGLLTNRHLGREFLPYSYQLRPEERYHIKRTMPKWAKRHGVSSASSAAEVWSTFQSVLMETLGDIALKHGVSVASVVLRWTLQLDHVASSVVTCRLCQNEEYDSSSSGRRRKSRSHELREVFKFSLDEDDMARLWEVSSTPPPLSYQEQQLDA